MSQRWKTLSIFIPEWDVNGVKIADINVSVVKAIYVPRSHLSKWLERKELKQPWIYFLFWAKDDFGKQEVYIGESDKLFVRLKQHNASKDFWEVAICFVSEKNNLTKAHIKFLENYCDQICKENSFIELKSCNTPSPSQLDESNTEFCYSFFDDLKAILGTLGFPIFEIKKVEKNDQLICAGKWKTAYWYYQNGAILVLKGSEAWWGKEVQSAWKWVIWSREALLKQWVLSKKDANTYIFTKDYVFSSLSTAAAVVLGRRSNGWLQWKQKNGKTIDEIMRK